MQAAETGYFRSGGRGLCGQSPSAGHLRAPLRDGCLVDQTWPDVRPAHWHLAAVCLHRYRQKHSDPVLPKEVHIYLVTNVATSSCIHVSLFLSGR